MDQFVQQILDILIKAKVELHPIYAVLSAVVMGLMSLAKDPNRLKLFTVVSKKTRGWIVAVFAFVLTFATSILLLQERDWIGMTAVSVIVGLCAMGAHDWLSAVGGKKDGPPEASDSPTWKDDPRRS